MSISTSNCIVCCHSAAIDANAGGRLTAKDAKPSSDDLAMALQDKPMVITLGVWDMAGNTGNWVMAVAPKNKTLKIGDKAPAKKSGGNPLDFNRRGPEVDDEIPF